jgi:hypothetical protein
MYYRSLCNCEALGQTMIETPWAWARTYTLYTHTRTHMEETAWHTENVEVYLQPPASARARQGQKQLANPILPTNIQQLCWRCSPRRRSRQELNRNAFHTTCFVDCHDDLPDSGRVCIAAKDRVEKTLCHWVVYGLVRQSFGGNI